MPVEHKDEEKIFRAVLKRTGPGERAAFLKEACGSDTELFSRVEALLRAYDRAGSFLEAPVLGPNILLDEPPVAEGPGSIIGRYKLLEKIGEGGMAVVYMAEQTEPIRRKVALKIIKLGMDTRQVIARFEAERQVLALMDHPSIAKVLDAGATETGRPYFVMELVQGVSITEYCDQNSLSTRDRLALFLQVCHAVQHAHQKGIIHRDIKPSNVMVTHHDGKPVPKVIDFGIAKATNQKLTEKTLFTRYAHIIGTPAYMSPEQAELSDLDIDTRSDIYSLGVLLYELLTGTTPFSEEELRKAGYIEMQRVIREQEPIKPSTKISTLGDTSTEIAKRRKCTPDLLRKAIRGDLDWIVMKSLEKDRVRRYDTASGLAEDIRRHLEHEPVLARGPSAPYRLRKFLRRHRSEALAGLMIGVLLIAAAVVLSIWNRDRLQLVAAEGLRHQAILFQAREQYANGRRQAALDTIQAIYDSPHVGPEAQLLAGGILVEDGRSGEAMAILGNLLHSRPEVAGTAHALLARVLWENESPEAQKRAEIGEHRRQAEALLPETAEAYFLRAITAATIKEQLNALNKALLLEPGHYESRRLRAFTYYASRKYERMNEEALVMETQRTQDPLGYSLRATALGELGRYQEAIAEYDSAMARTPTEDSQYLDLAAQRLETLLRAGSSERVVEEGQAYLSQIKAKDLSSLQLPVFFALTTLGEYDKAADLYRRMIGPMQASNDQLFGVKCSQYVFDTLGAGRSWHPPGPAPTGAAFLPLVGAEERYQTVSAKARRINANGFNAHWSPDGKKLAYSMGIRGSSGVATYDLATKETELLVVAGRDPKWSPDGRYIVFARDRQFLHIPDLIAAERKHLLQTRINREVWLMKSDGTELRRLAPGNWPSWGKDSTCVYFFGWEDNTFKSISIEEPDAKPKSITPCPAGFPLVSPDDRYLAYVDGGCLKVKDLVSQAPVAEWPIPFRMWGVCAWSPAGDELCLGDGGPGEGLWICRFGQSEPVKVLDGYIMGGAWSPDRTKLVFDFGSPLDGIWVADLDPHLSTIEALGPARTMEEYFQERATSCTRHIEADPRDAAAYFERARYYHLLHEPARADADARRWSILRDTRRSSDSQAGALCGSWSPLPGPWSAMSLLGLGLPWGLDMPVVHHGLTFRTPANVEMVRTPTMGTNCEAPSITADGLMLYANASTIRPNGALDEGDLYVWTRETTHDNWGAPVSLGPMVNSSFAELHAGISADGLTLFFTSDRPGGCGDQDLWVTTRTTRQGAWSEPVNLGPSVNSPYADGAPSLSTDGLSLFFHSERRGGNGDGDLWVTTRKDLDAPWSPPQNLGPVVNSSDWEGGPSISADGRTLFFSSRRAGGAGEADLWVTRRATTGDVWTQPVNLGPLVNSALGDGSPCISPNGFTLYFHSTWRGAGLWQTLVEPVVDFNGDGTIGLVDLALLLRDWVTHETSCDIGPTPWGDGKVDIEDLKVFLTFWQKADSVNSRNVQ
jgi:serine/threonine protein kinase/Tol biopolymer transport system component